MENFTPLSATIGGILIGLAATMLLLTQGRIAGISNIVGDLLETNEDDRLWRILFIVGLIVGSSTYVFFGENTSNININPFQLNDKNHMFFMILGGLLVGFGSQIGSGCTSGHGVCGLGRFSMRSLTATITFMVTAGITVFVVRSLTGA
nr:YeeE/YedE family protein [Rhodospirillales bacterium]